MGSSGGVDADSYAFRLGTAWNRSVGTASSLASRSDRIAGVMISMPASAKASRTFRRNAVQVSNISSAFLVQVRSSYLFPSGW
jgi:hypothetical protein